MDNEIYSFAMKNTLEQIQKACPDVKHSFMFKEDGEIIARNENTPEQTIVKAINTFDSIAEKAQTIGSIDSVMVECEDGNVNVQHMKDLYLVTVTSKDADMKYINTLNNVLFPTVLTLLDKMGPAPKKPHSIAEDPVPEPRSEPRFEYPRSRKIEKHQPKLPSEYLEEELNGNSEPEEPQKLEVTNLPEPPISQFMVENIGGLLVPSDTVRIDAETISKWEELYPHLKIEEVEVEAFNGKVTQCKVKPLKDSKFEGKGIVQMPEKIQSTLEIKKGELVKVRPLVN